jgi:hypothetical protein
MVKGRAPDMTISKKGMMRKMRLLQPDIFVLFIDLNLLFTPHR